MKYIGAHVSISGGVDKAPGRAAEIGANALGIFTKNQRQWKASPLSEAEIAGFAAELKKAEIRPEHVIVHDSYLINIANPDAEKRKKSVDALLDEAVRVEQLGIIYLNFHPGSGLGEIDEGQSLALITEGVNEVLSETASAVLLLETTAGQGAHVGYRFEHLRDIIAGTKNQSRIGVCLDTCHIFAAGYDIRTADTYEATMAEFDRIVGLKKLHGLHLNDAKVEYGSRKDRHDLIGEGHLSIEAFRNVMSDGRLDGIGMILETPSEERWKDEVALLRDMSGAKAVE